MNRIRWFLIATLFTAGAIGSAQTKLNINCGGHDYTAADGTNWVGDHYFDGGDLLYTSDGITNSQDLPLYRSGRAGLYGDFIYNIPATNGSYNVTLHFAEIQYWNKGDRVFNVAINGAAVLTNFDIMANTAARTALTRVFPVTVTNGMLQVAVTGVYRRGLVNGIQIAPATPPAPAPPALTLSTATLSFSGTAGGASPAAQSVAVSNTGGGTMAWTAASNQTWLTVAPASGTNSGTLSIAASLAGLAAGSYSGTVTVSAAGATGSPQTIAVGLTVAPAPPALTLSTATLSFSGTAGGASPAAQSVAVSNTGGGTMAWTAASNQTWLTIAPASGTNSGTLSIAASLAGLAAGSYSGTATVSAAGSSKTITVGLTVAAAPALTVSTTTLSFSGTAGGASSAAQSVAVSNTGGGTMAWTAASNQTWLTVAPASGANSGTLSIAANLAGLAAGSYSGTVTVTAAGATGSPQTITVGLTVAAAPALTVSTTTLSFSGTAGGASSAAQSVAVSNTGGGTMAWTAASNQTWLTVAPASGTNSGTLSIAANLAGLAAGSYSGTVTVSAAGSSKTITVALTVAAAPVLTVSTASLSFSGTAGGANPAAQTVAISNTGGGTMAWTATSSESWLTVAPASGANSGTLSIAANLAGLAVGSYSGAVTVSAAGATGSPRTINVGLTIAAASPSNTQPAININCGGQNYTATDGTQWISDYYFNGGDLLYTSDGITNTRDLALYRSGRAGLYGDFSYSIPVQNGLYNVTLHFAEIQYWNKGDRVFNVAINGATVLANFDILGQAAARAAMTRQFSVNVANGTIQIDVTGVVRKGLLNGIQVASTGTAGVVPPALVLSGSALNFTATAGGANPAAQTVSVSNGGGGSLGWTAASSQNWLTVSPASGTGAGTISVRPAISGIPAGTYNGTVTVTAAGATGSPQTIAATLTVAAAPSSLTVSPASLSFSGVAGGTNPAVQSAAVSNTGGGSMAWTAAGNQGWLTVSPASGTNSGTLSIGANLSGLAAGSYNGAVTVTAAGATGSPQSIAVTLTVAATPPALTVSPASLSFSGATGGTNPAAKSVAVSNTGGGSMAWTAAGNQSWLTMSPASGTNSGTLSIGVNLSGLAAGSYSGAVTVTAAGATGSPQSIAVTLTVATAPITLSAAPAALSLNCAAGSNPYAQTLTISASGSPSWTATKAQSWLTLSQSSGAGAATISVGASAANMASGTYSDTITIASNAPNSPVTIAVTMNVSTAPPPIPGTAWYVAPNGSATGDGSIGNPWDIVTALNQPATVRPGDTIWLRAGKYGDGQTLTSHLVGTPSQPIVVRAFPSERAIIDAWLMVGCCDGAPNPAVGSYTWFWGLEFASYNPNRTSGTSGPPEWAFMYNHQATDVWGAGTKFINCIVHDTAGGLSVWNAAGTELAGNIVYNIGGYGSDRGHGHDFYLQNAAPSILAVTDNIGFNGFDMGLQAYGSSDAFVQNMQFSGNVIFNSGILYGQIVDNLTLGGGGGPSGMGLDSNHFYSDPNLNQGYNELGFLWTPRAHDAVVTNNYFIGGKQAIDLERWDTLTFQNNTVFTNTGDESMMITRTDQTTGGYHYSNNRYYGTGRFTIDTACDYWPCPNSQSVNFATWMLLTGLDAGSTFTPGAPAGVWTSVRPNGYEPGRANIVIYNWDLRPSVQVDLTRSGINTGDAYQIRDAENWFNGPVVSGTYTGSPVTIPMTGLTVAQPFGVIPYPPSHTAPQFGVFVLLSGNAMNVY